MLASVAPTPIRAPTAEREARGRAADAARCSRRPAGSPRSDARPISDTRGSADYRRYAGRRADGARARRLLPAGLASRSRSHEDAAHLHRQRRGAQRARRHARHAARSAARSARPDRHQGRLRQRQLRHLHGADGRRARSMPAWCWRWRCRAAASPPSRGCPPAATLHPMQQALVEHGGTQCGFCTPGIVLSAKALLDENPRPSEAEIRHAIAGNLCRCTGYGKIVEAIAAVAAAVRRTEPMTDGADSRAGAQGDRQAAAARRCARARHRRGASIPADLALPGMVHAQAAAQPARACAHPAASTHARGRAAAACLRS